MGITIRRPTLEDCQGWAYVHYHSWLETYPGLMPDEFLAQRSIEKSFCSLNKALDKSFLAFDGKRVIGFVIYEKASSSYVSIKPSSEIQALYVLKEYQHRKIGFDLLETAFSCLPEKKIALFVLKGNETAIKFYQRIGFVFTGHVNYQEVAGGKLEELEMVISRERRCSTL